MRIPPKYLYFMSLGHISLFTITVYAQKLKSQELNIYIGQAMALICASIISLLEGISEGARRPSNNQCNDTIRTAYLIGATFLSLVGFAAFLAGPHFETPSPEARAIQIVSAFSGVFNGFFMFAAFYDACKICLIGDRDDIQYENKQVERPARALAI